MKKLLLLLAAAGAGCSPDEPAKGGRWAGDTGRPGEARLRPVLRLKAAGPMTVPLSFTNGSDKPFGYVTSSGEVAGLDYSLCRDGKAVPRGPTPGPPPNADFTPVTLKPGEARSFNLSLRPHTLAVGEYDLRVSYRVPKGSWLEEKRDATPAEFTLYYTLVVE